MDTEKAEQALKERFPDMDYFQLWSSDTAQLDGDFTAAELRAIADALDALKAEANPRFDDHDFNG